MFSVNLNGYLQFLIVLLISLGACMYYSFNDSQKTANQIRATAWSRQDSLHIEEYRTDYIMQRDSLTCANKLEETQKLAKDTNRTDYDAAFIELNMLYLKYDSSFKGHALTSFLDSKALERIKEVDRDYATDKWLRFGVTLVGVIVIMFTLLFVLSKMNKQHDIEVLQKNFEMYKQ